MQKLSKELNDRYIKDALALKENLAKDGDVTEIEGKIYRYNAYQDCWNRVETVLCREWGHIVELSACLDCNACGKWDGTKGSKSPFTF